MPSRRPSAPRPSARRPLTVTGAPAAPVRLRLHGSLGGARASAPRRPRSRRRCPTSQPAPRTISATAASMRERVGAGPASDRCRGSAARDRPARPRRAAPRRRRARRRRRRCDPSSPRSPGKRTPPRTSGRAGSSREAVDVEALADPDRHQARSAHALAGPGQVVGDGELAVVGLARHDDDAATSASTSAASSVPLRRPRAPARSERRGKACGVCTATSVARSGVATTDAACVDLLMVSVTGSPGTAPSAPARTAAMTARYSAAVGERPSGVVDAHDTSASSGTAASPQRTDSLRVVARHGDARPRARARPGGHHDDHAVDDRAGRRPPTSRAPSRPKHLELLRLRRSGCPGRRRRRSSTHAPGTSGEGSTLALAMADEDSSPPPSFFAGCRSGRARAELAGHASTRRARARRCPVQRRRRRRTSCTSCSRGRIAIANKSFDGRESVVALMESGDLFGEMGMLDGLPALGRGPAPSSRPRCWRIPLRAGRALLEQPSGAAVGRRAHAGRSAAHHGRGARRLGLPRRHRTHRQAPARTGRRGQTSSCCPSRRRSWPGWSAPRGSG